MAVKKILTGCLVVVLLAVVGAVAGWWFILRPMWNAGLEGAKEWVSAVDLGSDITNQAPYDPPADGRMTPAQVEAFVRVQKRIAADMGPDLARLARQAGDRAQGGAAPSLADLGNAYGELAGSVTRLRTAQAAGVNEVGLSREEYAWIRRQSLAAMSQLVPMPNAADVAGLAGLPGLPDFTAPEDAASLEAARHNAELLRPHLPLLRETLGAMP